MSIFNNLVGKRINRLALGDGGWALVFYTIDGKSYQYHTANDCCNSVWVNHINGIETVFGVGSSFDILRGALVTSVEDKGWGDNRTDEDGYDVVQDGFWTITTDHGPRIH